MCGPICDRAAVQFPYRVRSFWQLTHFIIIPTTKCFVALTDPDTQRDKHFAIYSISVTGDIQEIIQQLNDGGGGGTTNCSKKGLSGSQLFGVLVDSQLNRGHNDAGQKQL